MREVQGQLQLQCCTVTIYSNSCYYYYHQPAPPVSAEATSLRLCAGGQMSVVQALLEELPGQFLAYMRARGIKPQVPRFASAPVYPPQQ
jgi:hypothetical protein